MQELITIRPLLPEDLAEVTRIQEECYRDDLIEASDSFAAKISARPGFCFMAEQEGVAQGYVIALPWVSGQTLELDSSDYAVPANADCIYVHDVAVCPPARSLGAAGQLLETVINAAEENGFKRICLVAVQGAASYWHRHGFEVVTLDAAAHQKLARYGDGARYMVRRNDALR